MEKYRIIIFKIAKLVVLAVIPFVLMFLGAFLTMLITIRGNEVAVPNIVGIDQDQAVKILVRNELAGTVAGSRFSSEFGTGQVVMQLPEAGTRVKKHKAIKLIISEGRQQVVVPQLVGLTLKEAQIILSQSGLKLGLISRAEVLGSHREQIIQQFPPAGFKNLVTPHVNLLLNLGRGGTSYLMPELKGQRAQELSGFLTRNGFVVRPFEYEQDFVQPAGTVLAHYPEMGYSFNRATPIQFVVAR